MDLESTAKATKPSPDHNVSTVKIPASAVNNTRQNNKRPIDPNSSDNPALNNLKRPKLDTTDTQHECLKIDIGSKFESYTLLEKAIQAFQEGNFVQLYKRSSRGLGGYAKKCPKKKLNPKLLYNGLDFACIHGGKKFKTKSKGRQPNQL